MNITAGPWMVTSHSLDGWWIVINHKGNVVARVQGKSDADFIASARNSVEPLNAQGSTLNT